MTTNNLFNSKRVTEILQVPIDQRTELLIIEITELTYFVDFFSKIRTKYSISFHQACCKYLTYSKYTKNQYIYEAKDKADNYYILLSGSVSLLKHKTENYLEVQKSDDSSSEEFEELGRRTPRLRNRLVIIDPKDINQYTQRKYLDLPENEARNQNLSEENNGLIEFILNSEFLSENDKEIRKLDPGKDFGQDALVSNKRRILNAVARSEVELAVLSQNNFRSVLREIFEKKKNEKIDFLQSVSLFSQWTRINLSKIFALFESKTFTKGQFLFKEGEFPDSVFFVKKGVFKLIKTLTEEVQWKTKSFDRQIRRFKSLAKTKHKNLDLLLKSEKEMLGAEDILSGNIRRAYSCVCDSAISEVLCVGRIDFINKLLKTPAFEEHSKNLKINSKWLENRSHLLDEFSSRTMDSSLKHPVNDKKLVKKPDLWMEEIKHRAVSASSPKKKHFSIDLKFDKFLKKLEETVYMTPVVKERQYFGKPFIKGIVRRTAPPSFLISMRKKKHQKNNSVVLDKTARKIKIK